MWKNTSSNINEVIGAILNFLIFFYENILHAPKTQKSAKKHKKAVKALKALKEQRLNQLKKQNANKRTVKV